MTEDRLQYYRDYYRNIMQLDCTDQERDFHLSKLMALMERHFRIPMANNEKYNRNNTAVIELYRQVSNSRVTI